MLKSNPAPKVLTKTRNNKMQSTNKQHGETHSVHSSGFYIRPSHLRSNSVITHLSDIINKAVMISEALSPHETRPHLQSKSLFYDY